MLPRYNDFGYINLNEERNRSMSKVANWIIPNLGRFILKIRQIVYNAHMHLHINSLNLILSLSMNHNIMYIDFTK